MELSVLLLTFERSLVWYSEGPSMPSAFQVTIATFDDVPVLRLSGDLTFGQSISALHDAADQFKANALVVLDLTDLEMVDSTGISALIDARRTLAAASRVVLLRAPTRLQTSLDVTRVADLFELVDDEDGLRRALARSHGDST